MPGLPISTFIGSSSSAAIWSPGFGRIDWIDGRDLLFAADAGALAAAEPEIVAHMNEDHADAVAALCASGCSGRAGADWRMTGIDPEGARSAAPTAKPPGSISPRRC